MNDKKPSQSQATTAFFVGSVVGIAIGAVVGYFINNVRLGIGFGMIGGAVIGLFGLGIITKFKK